jgi:hypothetical protein
VTVERVRGRSRSMPTERTNSLSVSSEVAARLAGGTAVVVGGMVLVGWALDITALKSILPGWVTVKPNAALAFVLLGVALLFCSRRPATLSPRPLGFASRFAQLCALLAGLIALLTLCEYAFRWNAGIDQWLFPEPSGAAGTSHPGRMAPDSALCFALLAAALWLVSSSRRPRWTSLISGMIGSVVTSVALSAGGVSPSWRFPLRSFSR